MPHPRRVRVLLATLVVCLSGALPHPLAAEPSFLWKVSRGDRYFYLAGSVHMLTKAHYPLAPAFDAAFADSNLLVEEVDYQEMMDPKSQMMMLQRGMFSGADSLKTVLSPETYALVSERVGGLGLPMMAMERFKPWFLALTVAAMEWQRAGFDQQLGLDRHFYDRARASRMATQALETVEYQVRRFDDIPLADQDRLLASSIRDVDAQQRSVTDIATAWQAGDAVGLERLVLAELKSDPLMYQRLLVERNLNWMPVLESLLLRSGPAFVLVGAAHLVGPDGLLTLLQARGYTLEQM